MMRLALVVAAIAVMMSFAVPAVYATTYYGPSFGSPTAIAPGNPLPITLAVGSGTTAINLPQGGMPQCSGTCVYPQYAWTTANGCFISIHKVTVKDPSGDRFMLGSATTSGLYWPTAFGGSGSGTSVPPQAVPIDLGAGDSFTVPLGTGTEGFTFTSNLALPAGPTTVSAPYYSYNSEGPYYWWIAGVGTGNPNGYTVGQRLDVSGINPTMSHGTYTVDIEGSVLCGSGTFTTFTSNLFFDAGIVVTTPQFPVGMGLVLVAGLAGLILIKKSHFSPLPTVHA